MTACYTADMETSTATISVIQVTAINAGRVLALADVELILDGVSFSEQARLVRAIGSPRDEPASY
jgi:stage V sporulation protein G